MLSQTEVKHGRIGKYIWQGRVFLLFYYYYFFKNPHICHTCSIFFSIKIFSGLILRTVSLHLPNVISWNTTFLSCNYVSLLKQSGKCHHLDGKKKKKSLILYGEIIILMGFYHLFQISIAKCTHRWEYSYVLRWCTFLILTTGLVRMPIPFL